MFRIGQKVVCVDDERRVLFRKKGWFERFRKFERLCHNLNAGDVYTVTAIGIIHCDRSNQDVPCVFLNGAWHLFGFRRIPFPEFQFRPVIERKTDISIFTTMLAPKKQGVEA